MNPLTREELEHKVARWVARNNNEFSWSKMTNGEKNEETHYAKQLPKFNELMSLFDTYSTQEEWWIARDKDGNNKVLGPFATSKLANKVRSYVEVIEAPETFWIVSSKVKGAK